MPAMRADWDIFCNVIDNYGDIGVAWRLARQIASERGETVRLWVDDLAVCQQLVPELDTSLAVQRCRGVDIRAWPSEFPAETPAHRVIEAFACRLPDTYLNAMATQTPPPVWINLDYLSAEIWAEDCHGLPSRHPRLPLTQQFFFPGFSARSGGLLREAGLIERRQRFARDPALQAEWLDQLGIEHALPRVSLFCYANAALPALLETWATGPAMQLFVTDGKARTQVADWLGKPLHSGDNLTIGALQLHALPFLSQDDYDHLLWSCDLNFVRGEDSFVRAQWAARPMVWHIYPQQDAAHLIKLQAFLERYLQDWPADAANAVSAFWSAWVNEDAVACRQHWPAIQDSLIQQRTLAKAWADQLASQPDLLTRLARV
ncbi:elongation factor P maturation arginine rhamnosyltransferase EarP [Chitinimonas sp. BJYL2]|uniref:elongation factor P maturation arginine rhamnosyltransferase EarP n=1 Tax=Chitinimonas sp. BJYL2 TaxID=2976696 RepID=UPI0022B3EE6F|nr:elongation factor P maturation arginine rhamnosyltransferase EarP [Chitinimonas sp. BJYL2]